jgi:predicted metallo-beta-lactamase superfamily hydrolase
MKIEILATESLGVRGLCCSVQLKNHKIVIDPGIALGWLRHGLPPHPFQIAVGSCVREKIVEELKDATDVIISHFHGDHCPLYDPNPYQLGIDAVRESLSNCRIWAKGTLGCRSIQQRRRQELAVATGKALHGAEGKTEGVLQFSLPVAHGEQGYNENTVMMSRVEEDGEIFVHASDIQLIDETTVQQILDWRPEIVLVSGPPLYRFNSGCGMQREKAWKNARELSRCVDALIIDHHLLRSEEGIAWLKELSHITTNDVFSAAGFMNREPVFMEAWREELYEWLPVSETWHRDYQNGSIGIERWRVEGWETLVEKGKISPCKWYYCCPIKRFTEQGQLDRYWIENYCLVGNKSCVRYKMEAKGQYHPNNMLPDGKIRDDLR